MNNVRKTPKQGGRVLWRREVQREETKPVRQDGTEAKAEFEVGKEPLPKSPREGEFDLRPTPESPSPRTTRILLRLIVHICTGGKSVKISNKPGCN